MAAGDLAHIPEVDIDSDGVFKYVLIRVHAAPPSGAPAGESKEVVRGYKWAEYHGEGGAACIRGRGLVGSSPAPVASWAGRGRVGGSGGQGVNMARPCPRPSALASHSGEAAAWTWGPPRASLATPP